MATLHFVNLSPQIKAAVENGLYTKEEIIELNKRIKTDERKKEKTFRIAMPLIALFLFVSGIIIYGSQIGFPEALPLLLMNILAAAIVAPISWYAAIGRMAKQWDDLMYVYHYDIYMDNKYGKVGQSEEEPKKAKPAKPPVSGKSILKKVYYIITLIFSVLITAIIVIAEISSLTARHTSDYITGICATIVVAGIAAGSAFLSLKGLCRDCHIPGIILEKAGVLFIGISLIVFITGIFSDGEMLGALAIAVPALIIGCVCFMIGIKKERPKMNIPQMENSYE